MCSDQILPCDFEDSQQADTAEHRDTERGHDFQLHQNRFSDSATHHEAVKTVKQRNKIGLEPETVHLDEHFTREQGKKHLVGHI